jgi:transposase InsO family protein
LKLLIANAGINKLHSRAVRSFGAITTNREPQVRAANNKILLENYYLPGDFERQIKTFVDYYNNQRYHESLNNVTPADFYFSRDRAILRQREKIRANTIKQRRLQQQKQAA